MALSKPIQKRLSGGVVRRRRSLRDDPNVTKLGRQNPMANGATNWRLAETLFNLQYIFSVKIATAIELI